MNLVFQIFTIYIFTSHLRIVNAYLHFLLAHCLIICRIKWHFLAAPTVQLMFSSHQTKLTAEKLGGHILEAFETVLGSPVTIEIRCESKKDSGSGVHVPLILPPSKEGSSQIRDINGVSTQAQIFQSDNLGMGRSEIVEVAASLGEPKGNDHVDNHAVSGKSGLGGSQVGEGTASSKKSTVASLPERRKLGEQSQSQSLVRSKVSLAHVIQQAEGCTQRSGWSKRKAVSIAEKLEQENLYVKQFQYIFSIIISFLISLYHEVEWH